LVISNPPSLRTGETRSLPEVSDCAAVPAFRRAVRQLKSTAFPHRVIPCLLPLCDALYLYEQVQKSMTGFPSHHCA
jgi:hypothetical protein